MMWAAIFCLSCLFLFGLFRVASVASTPQYYVSAELYKCAAPIPVVDASQDEGKNLFMSITDHDRHIIECVVQGEAGNESLEGKIWVATCLLNAMRNSGIDAETARVSGQYAGWNENVSDETKTAVSMVFDDGQVAHDSVLWFYAPRWCESDWHESQQFVAEIGGHRFFAPKED